MMYPEKCSRLFPGSDWKADASAKPNLMDDFALETSQSGAKIEARRGPTCSHLGR